MVESISFVYIFSSSDLAGQSNYTKVPASVSTRSPVLKLGGPVLYGKELDLGGKLTNLLGISRSPTM